MMSTATGGNEDPANLTTGPISSTNTSSSPQPSNSSGNGPGHQQQQHHPQHQASPTPHTHLFPATPGPPTGPGLVSSPSASKSATPSAAGAGQPSFRRQRASRACETCHARKVRCDAASLGVPCTNCVAFSIECKIPTPKRGAGKKDNKAKVKDEESSDLAPGQGGPSPSPAPSMASSYATRTPATREADRASGEPMLKPSLNRAPIKEAGRVAFLGESSNFGLLVRDETSTGGDVVHYPLPENITGARSRMNELDSMEIDILKLRGAFLLPPRSLCDELVEAFFAWVAPVVPVVNKSRFMRQYRDPKNPPSLLLLQSILLAGSRVCYNPQLMDANGSTTPAAMTFYKRAKALYDAGYEDDRVTIVQSLILMGWYWEGPEDVTKNVFYWSRVATIVAQGSGMHRSVEHSQLSRADKRLWKRIWWTLFTRDRSVAVALGRPQHINTDDSDVEMLTESDFLEDEPGFPAEYPPNPLHVQFFLHYVKLCEIMGLVLAQQYSVASKFKRQKNLDLTQSDLALADWIKHVPDLMRYHVEDKERQNFWAALLHSTYYTTLCLLHRAQMSNPQVNYEGSIGESRNIAFRAAAAITSIVENLISHNELRFCPAFIVYSLFSALIMHVYQSRSTHPQVVENAQRRIKVCMEALKEISRVWMVAKMVSTLFESIIGNKVLEERLQKSTARRHHRGKSQHGSSQPIPSSTDPVKRKFDEMDIGGISVSGPGPSPNISYERSRPQTPAPLTSQMAAPGATPGKSDGYIGQPRGNGRPSTPGSGYPQPVPNIHQPQPQAHQMNHAPELFLVTRSSTPINASQWENFQPNQLFPEDSGLQHLAGLGMDPSMSPQTMHAAATMNHSMQYQLQQQQAGIPIPTPEQGGYPGPGWTQRGGYHEMDSGMAGSSPEDSWSTSSTQGLVPTALNVEDWFNFFGLNGDLSGMDTHMAG